MFLQVEQFGINDRGEEVAHGLFLVVFQKDKELRAVVRHARLRQCGHWMMGTVAIGADRVTLSGSYGADGLTIDGERYPSAWEKAVPLGEEMTQAFWSGEGRWNSAGSEAPTMRTWAKKNPARLRGKAR